MFDMHHYVAMTGGGYFFTPSLSAVQFLANPTTTWEQQETIMGDLSLQQLGELIGSENPYGQMTDIDLTQITRSGLGTNFSFGGPPPRGPYNTPVLPITDPLYWKAFFWTVGSATTPVETVRVSKAVRIKYKVGRLRPRADRGLRGRGRYVERAPSAVRAVRQ